MINYMCLFIFFLLFTVHEKAYHFAVENFVSPKKEKHDGNGFAISVSVGPTYYSRGPSAAELLTHSVHTPLEELL